MTEITSAVVQAIQKSTEPQIVTVGGLEYLDRPLYLPPAEPAIQPLKLSTLQGLIDFCKEEIGDMSGCFLHVASPQSVYALTELSMDRTQFRDTLAIADCSAFTKSQFNVGSFASIEAMLIELLSEYADAGDRDEVLSIISNITTQDIEKLQDDGITQTVTTEKGFRLEKTTLKNIVALHPYCTFREIEQPSRKFLLRMRKGKAEKEAPTVALFRADGDAWKLQAMESIKQWLESALAAKNLEMKVIA